MPPSLDIEHPVALSGAVALPRRGDGRLVAACQIATDIVMLEIGLLVGLGLRAGLVPWFPIGIGPSIFAPVHGIVALLPAAYAAAGLYPGYGMTPVERLRKRVMITVLCFASMILFDYLALGGQWSRGVLLGAMASGIVLGPLGQSLLTRLLIRHGRWGMPVAIFGAEQPGLALADNLRRHPLLGLVPVVLRRWPRPDEPPVAGVRVAILVLTEEARPVSALTDRLPYRRIMIVPHLHGTQRLWVTTRDLGGQLGLEMRRDLHAPVNRAIKRTMDLAIVLAVLVPGLVVIGLSALLVKLVSRGPAFFVQERLGRDGRPFRLWKIRSMRVGAEAGIEALLAESPDRRQEWDRHMKLRDDPRIIPGLGRILRRWSLDELPQLWHVLTGQMSLVGPRPLPAYHSAALSPEIRRLRASIAPGMTGLVQVSGRSDNGVVEQEDLDAYYIRNWSLWLDLHILGLTVGMVLRGQGAR